MDGEKEDSAGERAVGRAHDGRLPVEHVVADGTRGALRRWIPAQILQLLRYALQSHFEERLNECQRAMRAPTEEARERERRKRNYVISRKRAERCRRKRQVETKDLDRATLSV